MIVSSEKNSDGNVSLDLRLEKEDYLEMERIKIKTFVGEEKYNFYKELANKGRFNDIPYSYIAGYECNGIGIFRPTKLRLREYFRERYDNNKTLF